MTEKTYNVVVVRQQENWEDDGGSHDPILLTVTEDVFTELERLEAADAEPMNIDFVAKLLSGPDLTCPCQLDGVFNIWWTHYE